MRTRTPVIVLLIATAGAALLIATGVIDVAALLSPAPAPLTHTVVRGDTLSKLARTHGCSVADLKSWNGLSSDLIDVGQVLVVGYSGEARPVSQPGPPGGKPRRNSSKKTTKKAAAETSSPTGLSLPPERPCLAGPSVDGSGDEPEFAASAGLSHTQTRQAMDRFLPQLHRCIEGDWPDGTVRLSITVACTGRVDRVGVLDGGGLSGELTSCIAETLQYAPFPAHDLPDGETFTYPMTFSH